MKKITSWIWDNILFLETIFLLAFIPLYPKLPLLDVKNTWVYIRVEDFLVLFVLISWIILLIKKKVSLKTPLTIPIMVFWIVGGIATIHGVVLIFPTIANVFPNVAFLEYLRHLEYMCLFFIAYSGIREKKNIKPIIVTVVLTLLGVVGYGFGQKYLGFPAFLTMNEEFAKGVPIYLSDLSRIPSTFAGHYDLAAYLVLVLPIVTSLIFGVKNIFGKIVLALSVVLGFALIFFTVSRVSFVAVILSIFAILFFYKRKLVIALLPLLVVAGFLFVALKPTLLTRFTSTVSEVNVLVDGATGESIGHVKFVPREYFKNKIILQRRVDNTADLVQAMLGQVNPDQASQQEFQTTPTNSSSAQSSFSAVLKYELLPPTVPLVEAVNVSNGESLPQGTGYINLPLSPVTNRLGNFFYEFPPNLKVSSDAQVLVIHGDFIVKRAAAYDLSFTTRFQGEWPHALEAFARNVFFGSGYGSVSLAVDNNYFRMLGEIGILGVASFFAIFLALGIYIRKTWDEIDSKLVKSFVIGFAVGVVGLSLNATLIDVFEASKIAFILWLLVGVTLGILGLYQKKDINFYHEMRKAVTSPAAIIVYLLIATITIYSPMLSNFFVADDFTWFRWVADCSAYAGGKCPSIIPTFINYFTHSDGFFYRPGTKIFFYLTYSIFWLNQVIYHSVSLFLHFLVAALFFLLARKILKNNLLATAAAGFFLIMSGYSEAILWISSIGYLFTAVFALSSILLFSLYREKKSPIYLVLTYASIVLGLLFHEVGVVVPLFIIVYQVLIESDDFKKTSKKVSTWCLFIPDAVYLIARFLAQSHWSGGDYSYNIIKLPFNLVGNALGYLLLTLVGPLSLSGYEKIRDIFKTHIAVSLVFGIVIVVAAFYIYKFAVKLLDKEDKRIVVFGVLFFLIGLAPFLGLGNITSRYSYISSFGLIIILVYALKKVYEYLKSYGRDVAVAGITTIIVVFSLLHIIELQEAHLDWHGAGQVTNQFFISVDDLFTNEWNQGTNEIHFVNVPAKNGQAWIFPVGINDAVWFAFKNSQMKVVINSSVSEALGQVGYTSLTKRVFEFNPDGSLKEDKKPYITPVTPAETKTLR